MICQRCGTKNEDDAEICSRCQSRLFILSGSDAGDDFFEDVSVDEFLLERISSFEKKVANLEHVLIAVLESVHGIEQNLLVEQAGMHTIREILENKNILDNENFLERWEQRLNHQFLSREKAEKVLERIETIRTQFKGLDKESFSKLLNSAALRFQLMDDKQAYNDLIRAFEIDQKNFELCVLIGELLIGDGEVKDSFLYLEKALTLQPSHFGANLYMALAYVHENRIGEAKSTLEICKEINPRHFLVHFILGMIQYEMGELPDARESFSAARALREHPQVLLMQATVYYETGESAEAMHVLTDLLEFEPENDEAHFMLGLCYLERNWNRKAEEEFRQALRMNPSRLRFQQALAMSHMWSELPAIPEKTEVGKLCREADTLLESGKVERAISLYRKALQLDPGNDLVSIGFAIASLHAQQYDQVVQLCTRLIKRDLPEVLATPTYATLLFALRILEKHQEGIRFAREMVDNCNVDYARTIAYNELAYHMAQLGRDLDEAYHTARMARDIAPEELLSECEDILGWTAFKIGKMDEAYQYLSSSINRNPNTSSLLRLGMVCLQIGKRDEARSAFQEARRTSMKGPDLHWRLWSQITNGLRRKST